MFKVSKDPFGANFTQESFVVLEEQIVAVERVHVSNALICADFKLHGLSEIIKALI